jgi:hypothetical protein
MSQENVEIVKRAINAFNRRDLDGLDLFRFGGEGRLRGQNTRKPRDCVTRLPCNRPGGGRILARRRAQRLGGGSRAAGTVRARGQVGKGGPIFGLAPGYLSLTAVPGAGAPRRTRRTALRWH